LDWSDWLDWRSLRNLLLGRCRGLNWRCGWRLLGWGGWLGRRSI
jgi:hypothetical protein